MSDMKIKSKKYIGAVLSVVVIFSLIGCSKLHEKKYYSDMDNYITEEAIVDNIIYDEEQEYIVIWLSEIDEEYQCSEFIIEGKSIEIVLENEVVDKIKIGDKIKYTSAPKFFGNGDFMPIVEISIDGDEILSFEEGYENLISSY